ncbi:hypothetical protein AAVH_39474, partial [Aphelenchoides avenae]
GYRHKAARWIHDDHGPRSLAIVGQSPCRCSVLYRSSAFLRSPRLHVPLRGRRPAMVGSEAGV